MPSFGRQALLFALALSMESMFAVIAFLPLAPIVVLTALFYNAKFAIGAGIFLFVGCWYVLQPSFELDEWHREVPKSDALWQLVRDLCQKLDAPVPHRIVLCDEFNAFAHSQGGVLALFGVKRILGIGIPLLRVLNVDEVQAVVAHELGHFSRRHNRLGQWIYRVRCKWVGYAYVSRDDEGVISGAISAIAERVVPVFLARSARWSTQCEFEADSSARQIQRETALATGLQKMHAVSLAWRSTLAAAKRRQQLQSPHPPEDFWQLVLESVQAQSAVELNSAVDDRRRRVLGIHRITHPPLGERIAALGIENAPTLSWDAPCAGEVVFAAGWQAIYAEFADRARRTMEPAWRIEHHRLRWSVSVLRDDGGEAAGEFAHSPPHLVAAEHLYRNQTTIDALALSAKNSTGAALNFAYGKALLQREDDIGKEYLRESYRIDRTFAPAATGLIAAYDHEFGTFEQARAAIDTADAAAHWAAAFTEGFRERLYHGEIRSQPPELVEFARTALAPEERLDACWSVRVSSRTIKERTFSISVFVLRIVPDSAVGTAPLVDEDELVAVYTRLLTVALPANELVRCATFYTTEPIDPKLLRRFEQCAGSEVIAPRAPLNVNMIKFDHG